MSHRSYQPSNSCGSKLLQQRWDKAYYDEHRRLVIYNECVYIMYCVCVVLAQVKSAKPMVDTSAPHKPPHVIAKWKKQQVKSLTLNDMCL